MPDNPQPDNPQTDSPQPDSPQPGNPADAEEAFWAKLDQHLDGWWTRKNPPGKPKDNPNPGPGTSRVGGKRVTLSSLFADAVFGPENHDR